MIGHQFRTPGHVAGPTLREHRNHPIRDDRDHEEDPDDLTD
jgi:hypothetical protein